MFTPAASIEHTRTVERAYVKLSHVPPGLKSEPTGLFFVRMRAKNTGRTPASVTDMRVKPVLILKAKSLPAEPNYKRKGGDTHKAFLVANGSAYFGDNFSITPSELEQVKDGTLKLYLIGYVDYMDASVSGTVEGMPVSTILNRASLIISAS